MQLVGAVAEVHVDRGAPELHRRVERLEVFGPIGEVDGDPVAGHHVGFRLQVPREAGGAAGELGPRDVAGTADDRVAVGDDLRDAVPHRREVPTGHAAMLGTL